MKPTSEVKGLRVLTCGHSFHAFMPEILQDMAEAAGIQHHETVGVSAIGGSKVIEHWDVPEEENLAKKSLRAAKVDVLTLSPVWLPDEGIEKFAELALAHNSNIRITVQEFWLPKDVFDPTYPLVPAKEPVDFNALTGVELRKRHAPYFQGMDDFIRELNQRIGRQVLFIVPVGQAVIALREKIIAGEVPGLATQGDLFADDWGHPTPPIQALAAYCHFSVIYRRTPLGLSLPAILASGNLPQDGDQPSHPMSTPSVDRRNTPHWDNAMGLNRLLQELAWDAVMQHPLSGVERSACEHAAGRAGGCCALG